MASSRQPGGRPITYPRREIVNAIRYDWLLLADAAPPPPWRIVFHYSTWRRDAWQRVHDVLHAELRQAQGRQASPSAAIIDSQSVKTTEKGGQRLRRGQVKGASDIVVDTLGLPLAVAVHPAEFRTGTAPGWCWPGCWAVSLDYS